MMGLENPIHLIFLLAVLLMLFGAKRLPEMGRGLGHGMRGFKDALSGESPATSTHEIMADPAEGFDPAVTLAPVVGVTSVDTVDAAA
jgi:sec-independent protein translocase protein TatA